MKADKHRQKETHGKNIGHTQEYKNKILDRQGCKSTDINRKYRRKKK
jgi:hypothetical protein